MSFNFFQSHVEPLCLCGGEEGSSPAPCSSGCPCAYLYHYTFHTTLLYFIVHMSVSPTKAISSLKVFLCPQYLAQCLTYSRLPTFLYYSLLLVYCKDVKFNKQNKEDRTFWVCGSINIINIIYNYLYLWWISAFSTPLHCQHLAQTLTYSVCWISIF